MCACACACAWLHIITFSFGSVTNHISKCNKVWIKQMVCRWAGGTVSLCMPINETKEKHTLNEQYQHSKLTESYKCMQTCACFLPLPLHSFLMPDKIRWKLNGFSGQTNSNIFTNLSPLLCDCCCCWTFILHGRCSTMIRKHVKNHTKWHLHKGPTVFCVQCYENKASCLHKYLFAPSSKINKNWLAYKYISVVKNYQFSSPAIKLNVFAILMQFSVIFFSSATTVLFEHSIKSNFRIRNRYILFD